MGRVESGPVCTFYMCFRTVLTALERITILNEVLQGKLLIVLNTKMRKLAGY